MFRVLPSEVRMEEKQGRAEGKLPIEADAAVYSPAQYHSRVIHIRELGIGSSLPTPRASQTERDSSHREMVHSGRFADLSKASAEMPTTGFISRTTNFGAAFANTMAGALNAGR